MTSGFKREEETAKRVGTLPIFKKIANNNVEYWFFKAITSIDVVITLKLFAANFH